MKRWLLWLMYKAFETSYFMDVSLFFHLFVYSVRTTQNWRIQLSCIVVGWCRLDHCNSRNISNQFLCFLSIGMAWNWRIQSSHPSASWNPGPRGSWLLSFSSSSYRRPVAWGNLAHPSLKSSIYHPLIHLLTEVGSRPPFLSTYQAWFPELKPYFLESLPIWSPHQTNHDIKRMGVGLCSCKQSRSDFWR